MEGGLLYLVCAGCVLGGLVVGAIVANKVRGLSSPPIYKLLRSHFAPTSLATVSVTERQFPASSSSRSPAVHR